MTSNDAPGLQKDVTIFVNSREHTVQGPTISYEEVAELAYPGKDFVYSISYTGGKGGKDGILLPGKKVPLEEQMEFDVTPTDKS